MIRRTKIAEKMYEKETEKKLIIIYSVLSLIIGIGFFIYSKKLMTSFLIIIFVFSFFSFYQFMKLKLEKYKKIRKMEEVFPDFLQFMSSNLRAGMTTDRALLMAARNEFYPLNLEISKVGKELMTGRDIESSLKGMSDRINSEKIRKTIELIVSGIQSGGNIAILLEETATNTREREFIQKRAASNVLMYVIFIFVAITVGAPALFGLSNVLVEVLSSILAKLPEVDANVNIPFTLTKINVPIEFISYFSIVFIVAMGIIGSLVLGLIMKGEEREGVKYIIPVVAISAFVFFVIKVFLAKYFSRFFNV